MNIRTLEELGAGLQTLYETRYSHFYEKQDTPFITYIETDYENVAADNKIILEGTYVDIELYDDKKNLEAERKIKSFLNANNLPYTQSETIYIESERFYQTILSIKLLNKPMEVL